MCLAGQRIGIAGIAGQIDGAVEPAFGFSGFDPGLIRQPLEENAVQPGRQRVGRGLAVFQVEFSSEPSAGERSLNLGQLKDPAVPGKGAPDFVGLKNSADVHPSDADGSLGREIGRDGGVDIGFLEKKDGAVFGVEETDLAGTEAEALKFRLE